MAVNLRRQIELRVITQGAGNREKTREHLRDGVSVEALVTPESARYGSHEIEDIVVHQRVAYGQEASFVALTKWNKKVVQALIKIQEVLRVVRVIRRGATSESRRDVRLHTIAKLVIGFSRQVLAQPPQTIYTQLYKRALFTGNQFSMVMQIILILTISKIKFKLPNDSKN